MNFLFVAIELQVLVIVCSHVCLAQRDSPRHYTQTIPGTEVAFDMTSIPAGDFTMGSPETEPGRNADEGPQHVVEVDSLWVGTVEVTWDLFELFLRENKSRFAGLPDEKKKEVDAVSRPTPPFEDPSKGMEEGVFPW